MKVLKVVDAFIVDVQDSINEVRGKITNSEIIGALEMLKFDLLQEMQEEEN